MCQQLMLFLSSELMLIRTGPSLVSEPPSPPTATETRNCPPVSRGKTFMHGGFDSPSIQRDDLRREKRRRRCEEDRNHD